MSATNLDLAALFHGTCATRLDSITEHGLRGPAWVTDDHHRAHNYAARAVAVELYESGREDGSGAWPAALVVAVQLDPDVLVPDPAHAGDFVAREGCDPSTIIDTFRFDALPIVGRHQVRVNGGMAALARRLERKRAWQWESPPR